MQSTVQVKQSSILFGSIAIAIISVGISYLLFGPGTYLKSAFLSNKTPQPMSYHTNVIKDTLENENFRKVLFTGKNSQLVIMNILPGGEVGKETHKYTEQTLFFLSGTGEGELDGKKFPIVPGDAVVVVPGTEHNFRNTGTETMKIYTVYAPANHIDGRIQATKAIADADAADEAVGESAPACIQ